MGVVIEIERILSMGKPKNFNNTNLKKTHRNDSYKNILAQIQLPGFFQCICLILIHRKKSHFS